MNLTKLSTFIKKNKWLILASIFFLVWKFFLIYTLWQGSSIPPEPDDSYIYIGQIRSVEKCPTLLCEYPTISLKSVTGFTYLSYRVFFGIISKIFHIAPETVFHLSFYFGTILLLPVLVYLTKAFTKNKNLIALMILFLALYNGSGSYHGFFWVVPSFFAVLLFLLIIGILLNNPKYWGVYLTAILPIFIFIHPTSVYTIVVFPIFYVFYILLTKKWHSLLFKKIFLLCFVSLMVYSAFSLHIHNASNSSTLLTNIFTSKKAHLEKEFLSPKQPTSQPPSESTVTPHTSVPLLPAGPYTPQKKVRDVLPQNTFFPGITLIHESYTAWLFPHWLAYISFFLILFTLFYFKQFKLLSLYFSLLVFILISSLHEYGYRSLVFIWPVTYILYCVGFWYILVFLKNYTVHKLLKFLMFLIVIASFLVFLSLNIIYSYVLNKHTGINDRTPINTEYITYLETITTPQDKILYPSKLLYAYALNSNLANIPMIISNHIYPTTYIVILSPSPQGQKNNTSDYFFNTLSLILNKDRIKKQSFSDDINIPANFKLLKTFNNISIYK